MTTENNKTAQEAWSEPSAKALARYRAVTWIVDRMKDEHPGGCTLSCILLEASLRDWDGFTFGRSTLERHYYTYKKQGFASLCDKARNDKGQCRKLTLEQQDILLSMRRKHKDMQVTSLLELLSERAGEDVLQSVSISTVHRFFEAHGLDRTTLRTTFDHPGSGPQKAFEMPFPNMLWMTDMMHGVSFKTPENKTIRSRLFAFIDDHSRLCVSAQYFDSESFDCVLEVLRTGILRRGIPEKIYTDQGKVFTCKHLKTICANLDIRLSHARPYHAWSKGKVERFFRTVHAQFEGLLDTNQIHSLADLNQRLDAWLEQTYHPRIHRGTGETPKNRFADGAEKLRVPPNAEELDQLFMKKVQRRVGKDGCISLEAKKYEVPLSFRGRLVEVRHTLPVDVGNIQIYSNDKFVALAKPLNKHLNAIISK